MSCRGITRLALSSLLILFAGCGDPGAPPLLSRSAAGTDHIPGCHNVSPAVRATLPFTTDFYLTTSGSALREGSSVGVRDGLRDGGGVGNNLLAMMSPPSRVGNARLVAKSHRPEPFCMLVDAPHERVVSALSRVMSELRPHGYRAQRSPYSYSAFQTDFAFHSHQAARWTDRFIAYADPIGSDRTAVVVHRDVFISRQRGPYMQGESVGANETWILVAVRQAATGQ